MKQAVEFGVVDARPIPLRSPQQCAGTLQLQRVSGWRLAHLRSEQNSADRFPPVWAVEQQESVLHGARRQPGLRLFRGRPGRCASKPIVLPRVVVDLYFQCSNSQKID